MMPLCTRYQPITHGRRSIRRLTLTAAMLTGLAVTLAAPPSALAQDCKGLEIHPDDSRSHRSIVQEEAQDPANFPAAITYDGLSIHAGLSQSHRSIVQEEAQDPANVASTALAC